MIKENKGGALFIFILASTYPYTPQEREREKTWYAWKPERDDVTRLKGEGWSEQEIRDIPQIPFLPELKPLNYPILISLHKTSTHWLLLEQTKNKVRKEVKVKQAFYLLWLANMTEMGPGAWDPADV